MKKNGSKIWRFIYALCLLAFFIGTNQANGACTLGTDSCCLSTGGPSDNAATQYIWEPNTPYSGLWNWYNHWRVQADPNSIPDGKSGGTACGGTTTQCLGTAGAVVAGSAANEYAYIQSDWRIPAYPVNNYTLSCLKIASGTMTTANGVTITINSPAVVTVDGAGTGASQGHMYAVNTPIRFYTTGALPTGLTAGTLYFVQSVPAANTFTVSATSGGAAINTSGSQSGAHRVTQVATTTITIPTNATVTTPITGKSTTSISIPTPATVTQVDSSVTSAFAASAAAVTISVTSGTRYVQYSNSGLLVNDAVMFTAGTLPSPLASNTAYYVKAVNGAGTDRFTLTDSPGGPVITIAADATGLTLHRSAITFAGHGLSAGDPVVFATSRAPMTAGTIYYVSADLPPTTNLFDISTTPGGTHLTITGTGNSVMTRQAVRWPSHGLVADAPVQFTGGTLAAGLTASTVYYVVGAAAGIAGPATNSFSVSATIGGAPIVTTADSSPTVTGFQPSTFSYTAHGMAAGAPVNFTTTGTLPTGLTAGTIYYVAATPAPLTDSFYIAAAPGGAVIRATAAGTGTHTANKPGVVNWATHGLPAGTAVLFSGGTLPSEITANALYYVLATPTIQAGSFSIGTTAGGTAIPFTGSTAATITGKQPGVVTLNAHNLSAGYPVIFSTSGALPTGLTAGTTYYVASFPAPTANTFAVSATAGGAPIATTGTQSPTHTLSTVMTIAAEFFSNPNSGSLTTTNQFLLNMAGAAEQTLTNVDPINHLNISNNTTVNLTDNFTVSDNFTIADGTGIVKINNSLLISKSTTPVTIPASATLEIQSDAIFTALGGVVVNGVLKVKAGGTLLIGNGKTLQVNAGGVLQLIGNSGAVAKIDAVDGGSTYILNVAGSVNANYFSISRTTAPGLNITTAGSDSIQTLSNGEFHYLASGGYAVTLNTAKDVPTSPNPSGLGFFDDFAYANTKNFNATNYTGVAFTVSQWSGLGNTAYELDPSSKVGWGTQAPVALQVTNASASGSPPATIGRNSAETLFATFGFSLNGSGTATDITSVTFTLGGNNTASDVQYGRVYRDTNANCQYDPGVDLQVGSDLYFNNYPGIATVTIPATQLSVNSTTSKCLHVTLATSLNAHISSTIQLKIAGTADVTNSQAYAFSSASGPPVQGGTSTVVVGGSSIKVWNGGNGTAAAAQNWNANVTDWTPSGVPGASGTDDCQIGPAYSYLQLNANYSCLNVNLPNNGKMSFSPTTNTFTVLGALTIGSSYTFATSGNFTFASTVANQSITANTAFPGNVTINNTFNSGAGIVSVDSDFTVGGDLTLTSGVLRVTAGNTLYVNGNINVNGGTLKIEPGASVVLGDGKTLTVGASGTLEMVGSSAQNSNFTCAGTTTGCAVTVNGTIKAQYYSFSKLAVSGVTINSGATIDPTYYLQNGAFTFPVGTNPVLLTLNRQVPSTTWNSMVFDKNGSSATGAKSIVTTATASPNPSLTINNYSGDLTGNAFTTDIPYDIIWAIPTTTLKITTEDLVSTSWSATVTISGAATPAVVTWASHALAAGTQVSFTTTNALPTGLSPLTAYYVAASPAPTATTFSVAATAGGAAINTTAAGLGIQTATPAPISDVASPAVIAWKSHALTAGAQVTFTTNGTLPTGLATATIYYVASSPAPTANTFSVSTTSGGAALNTTVAGTGTHAANSTANNANQGDTSVRAGWFGFQETTAGTFANTDLTSIKITLDGTGASSDVSSARLYYDSTCAGSGGTFVGTAQTFSGSPATITFGSLTGVTVQSDVTSPPKRCVYVEYDVASAATSGATVIAKIQANGDVVNSQTYAFNGSFSPPKNGRTIAVVGNTTTWVGTTSTDWFTATNWSPPLVPTSAKNCIINDVTNDPVINAAGAVCKSLTIGNGILTINSGRNLDVFGSLTNTGTISQAASSSTITIKDGGTITNQTLQSSSALNYLVFDKTAGGYVYIGNQNLTINNFTIGSGKNFIFNVRAGDTLTLPNGATLSSATFQVDGDGTVAVGSGQTFLVNGATVKANGTNDGCITSYPGTTCMAGKALFTRSGGSGTWSFQTTSGVVDFTGWTVEWMDCNGMQIGGTTQVTNFNGGQIRNMPTGCGTFYGLQLNNSGGLPSTADYVGFNWGPNNTPLAPGTAYNLIRSTGCNANTMSFTNWFGDFSVALDQPVPSTKITTSNCTINMTAAASLVALTEIFKATPFNALVRLTWTTGLESLHQGFNVYRSTSPDSGYAQINGSLIRNPVQGGSIHGSYDFRDSGVTNNVTYYYRLEDIATNGVRTIHGPVAATPKAALGAAPAPTGNAVVAGNASGSGTPASDESTPGILNLAPGVSQLAKTKNSLRLRIEIPAVVRAASEVGGYEQLSIEGYATSTEAGKPELPERALLIEVPRSEVATFAEVSRTSNTLNTLNVVPAKTYSVDSNGNLVSSRAPDGTFYATNAALPASPIEIKDIIENQGLFYLPIIVKPIRYNPVNQQATALTQITFDVHFSGSPNWNIGSPVSESGAWGYEGSLKIHIKKSGLYKLRYSDLVNAGVDGPFVGANTSKLRLFSGSGEMPMQITSADTTFNDGDEIRFFAPYFSSVESDRNSLVLYVDTVDGLRMDSMVATPSGNASTQASYARRFEIKSSQYALFSDPVGAGAEHIYWSYHYFSAAQNSGSPDFNTDLNLPGLVNSGTVRIRLSLKGSRGGQLQNPIHHLKVYVNGSFSDSGDAEFQTNEPYSVQFDIPASQFIEGRNSIRVRVMGDRTGNDFDRVNFEKLSVEYPHRWSVESGVAEVLNYKAGKDIMLDGLTSGTVSVYDITTVDDVVRLTGFGISQDNGNFAVSFATASGDPSLGRRLQVVADSAVLLPWALELNPGSNLKATNQGADVLYIGPRRLMSPVARLAAQRRDDGFRTALVTTEDIYSEFGNGIRSPQAIKDFIAYAYANWQSPAPKYVVLIGDASYDPKNQLGYGLASGVPVYLNKGVYADYGDDHFYASLVSGSDVPLVSLGRIPGNNASDIGLYVSKVLAYENGSARPTGAAQARLTVISDTDLNGGEQFDAKIDRLAALIPQLWNPLITINQLKRSQLGDANLKAGILDAFNSGSLLIHFLGHGAEDRWADSAVFWKADAEALTNTQLPIVVAMNCLNGYFYDADPTVKSLTDSLLFNANGGAVAMFASTSLTSPELQVPMQDALYEYLAKNPGSRLGDAVRIAKVQSGINAGTAEVIRSWTLFGDPMLRVNVPIKTTASLAVPVVSDAKVAESTGSLAGSSCASIRDHGRKMGRPGWGAFAEIMIMLFAIVGGRLMMRQAAVVKVRRSPLLKGQRRSK